MNAPNAQPPAAPLLPKFDPQNAIANGVCPVPISITYSKIAVGGRDWIMLQFGTAIGVSVYFLDVDGAKLFGEKLRELASEIVVAQPQTAQMLVDAMTARRKNRPQ